MDVMDDVEAVLEFLSRNGFKEAESALKEDIFERGHFGSFDFEKFLFPMVPPPPPLKIPASSRRSEHANGDGDNKSTAASSGDDEFVSLGSSSSEVCNSEFTNPYGVRTASKADSEVSSDGLSQFGTARDYPDFVLENELYWYDDKDEGCFMTPSFGASDPFGCPTEDKFVMSPESGKQAVDSVQVHLYDNLQGFQSETAVHYLDKQCFVHVASLSDINENHDKDSFQMNKDVRLGKCNVDEPEGYIAYDCSASGCEFSQGARGFYDEGPGDNGCMIDLHDIEFQFARKDPDNFAHSEIRVKKSSDHLMGRTYSKDWVEGFKDITDFKTPAADKSDLLSGKCEVVKEKKANREHNEPQGVMGDDGFADDEQLLSGANDEEYEVFNLRIIHRKNRTGFEENKDLPIVLHTVIGGRYYVTEYLGSAAFSKVVQAHDLLTGVDFCLKIIKNDKDFFDQSLDEIKLLKFVNKYDPADEHHILRLYDYFYYQEHLFIVCELLKANLYEFQKFNQESGGEAYFTLSRLQVITRQILEALEYLHGLGIIHCDLKPENILIKSYRRCEIKVIDLGSSCFQTDNLCLYVQSRSYRAPEVILGLPYDQKIDLWSLGCILAELYSGEVLFPNDGVVMILARVIGMIGPIDLEMLENGQETSKYFTKEYDLYHINEEDDQLQYIIPEPSSLEDHLQVTDVRFIDFLRYLLEINPKRRPTASEALQHPWLD